MSKSKRKKRRDYINPKQRDNNKNSSSKSEGEDSLEDRCRGCIDKLLFYTVEQIQFSEIQEIADGLGARTERVRLPETGWTFRVIGPEGEKVSFFMWGKDKSTSRKVALRPSDFRSYRHMKTFVVSLIGRNEFESADNFRTDCAVDIPDDFNHLKKYVYATRKRFCRSYLNDGYNLNGLHIGRGKEVISVYDKAKQAKIPGPLTRIEVQLTGKDNPVKSLTAMPLLIDKHDLGYYKPFRKVGLEALSFTPIEEIRSRRELIRCIQAQTLTNELGGHLARRKCNKNGKFKRDFSNFVQGLPYPVDLNWVWYRDMCSFFGNPKRAEAARVFWDDDH